ncbi:hypothetical protein [Scatolibacter rhodanostii]|uniref:hypothetical protein n=1 Tax=Scatolibacter rhodanostii TaxID=2014781 RepID=UPI00117CC24A|nr:hypothetical protein [Scatolibacter rhodanostii]
MSQKLRIPQELPLKSVGGREKVSLSLMCVIAANVPPFGLMAAFIAPTAVIPLLLKALINYLVSFFGRGVTTVIMALPIISLCFSAT